MTDEELRAAARKVVGHCKLEAFNIFAGVYGYTGLATIPKSLYAVCSGRNFYFSDFPADGVVSNIIWAHRSPPEHRNNWYRFVKIWLAKFEEQKGSSCQ